MQAKSKMQSPKQSGFTMIETIIVIFIVMVIAAMAIPGYQATVRYLRMSGDGREINGLIAGAKMQAAADFSHARAYADLAANTFHMETWSKTAGCWQTIGDLDAAGNPRCTIDGTSPVQPPIGDGNGGTKPNAKCLVFNSRGVPIDGFPPTPYGNGALYITDLNTVYGVTANTSGSIQVWAASVNAPAGNNPWSHR